MKALRLFLTILTFCGSISLCCSIGCAEENVTGRIVLQFSLRAYYSEVRICNPSCGTSCSGCKPYRVIKDIGSDNNCDKNTAEIKKLFLLPALKSGAQKLTIFMTDPADHIAMETISIYVAPKEVKVYTIDLYQIDRAQHGSNTKEFAMSNKRFKTMDGFQEWAFDNGYILYE
ncbi:hypothetical protein ACFL38_00125 [Candidatus Omnitrophota bacterium]